MKAVFIGIWIILSGNVGTINCFHEDTKTSVKGISVIRKTPFPMTETSWEIVEDNYNLYYYKDYIIYKFNYRFDSLQNHQVVFQEKRYFYFAFHKDSLYGYTYYLNSTGFNNDGARVLKDSILQKHIFESKLFDTLAHLMPDSINNRANEYVKLYKNPPPPDGKPAIEEIRIYFFYSNTFQGIPETFSKKMDQDKGMKLYKIVINAGGGINKELNVKLPPREYLLEIKKIETEDFSPELKFFKRYEQENNRKTKGS